MAKYRFQLVPLMHHVLLSLPLFMSHAILIGRRRAKNINAVVDTLTCRDVQQQCLLCKAKSPI